MSDQPIPPNPTPPKPRLPNGTIYYDSTHQAAVAMGISLKTLKRCKKLGCLGFRNSRIYHQEVVDWMAAHKAELEDEELNGGLTIDEIKRDNLIKDGVLKDLDIRKKRREYLDLEDVRALLLTINTSMNAVLHRWPVELAPKLTGKKLGEIEKELTIAVVNLLKIFASSMEK